MPRINPGGPFNRYFHNKPISGPRLITGLSKYFPSIICLKNMASRSSGMTEEAVKFIEKKLNLSTFPVLERLIHDKESHIRMVGALILAQQRRTFPLHVTLLLGTLIANNEENRTIRSIVALTMGDIRQNASLAILKVLRKDPDKTVRLHTVNSLGKLIDFDPKETLSLLAESALDPDITVSMAARKFL